MGRFPEELSGGDKNMCHTDRSATIAPQRGKLCEPHQGAAIFLRSYQSTVKQTNCYQFNYNPCC